jgi:5-methylcytosine-specific restriction endonuclease McrA
MRFRYVSGHGSSFGIGPVEGCLSPAKDAISAAQRSRWQPVRSPLSRNSYEYRAWRISVLARDNMTCQECGATGTRMHAHHLKSFRQYPDLRFDVGNGRTLCGACHMKDDEDKKARLSPEARAKRRAALGHRDPR